MIPWQIPAIGAAICLAVLAAIAMAPAAQAFRKTWFAIAAFVLMLFAGTKPPQPTHLWRFEFQNGVRNAIAAVSHSNSQKSAFSSSLSLA